MASTLQAEYNHVQRLLLYQFSFMPFKNPTDQQSHNRRSNRRTKKIDRDSFITNYSRKQKHYRYSIKTPNIQVSPVITQYCQKLMSVNGQVHYHQLAQEMNRAFEEQRQKLFSLFKIKLQLGKEDLPQTLSPQIEEMQWRLQPQLIEKLVQMRDMAEESLENEFEDNIENSPYHWSSHQQIEQRMPRRESMKLLCDNYENNQLIYSVQTLIPRIAKQDVQNLI